MIAIVSTNKFKYSETFIQSHLEYLSNEILYLFDGYLPTRYSLDKLKTVYEINPLTIGELLNKHKVKCVLAEYGPSGVTMAPICKQANIPLVVHFHGFDAYRNDILTTYGKEYVKMFEVATAVIAVSKDMVEQLKKLGCEEEKIHYVPYGIDLNIFNIPALAKKKKQFVSCGRFVAKKGPVNTIQAFAKIYAMHNDTSLVMIGDGELLDNCKQLVVDLEIEKAVQFPGTLPQSEISKIFSESVLFLQHSIKDENNDSEGTPLVIMEAGAAGLPIVSTIHAGIPDIVENGKDGYLVAEKDVQSMTDKMLFLLNNPEKAITMGLHLQKKVIEHYSMERYIDDLKKILEINEYK